MSKLLQNYKLWGLRILAAFGFFGALELSYREWQTGTACPDIWPGLPACYVVALLFALILLVSFMKNMRWLAGSASVVGLAFAGYSESIFCFGVSAYRQWSTTLLHCLQLIFIDNPRCVVVA